MLFLIFLKVFFFQSCNYRSALAEAGVRSRHVESAGSVLPLASPSAILPRRVQQQRRETNNARRH